MDGCGGSFAKLEGASEWTGMYILRSSSHKETAERNRMLRLPRMFRAIENRNYRLYFCGQSVSVLGSWLQSVAQTWLVYRLTGSSLELGLVVFVGQAPLLFLSPMGGLITDRPPRRWVVVGTQTLSMLLAFGLAALTLLGHVQ